MPVCANRLKELREAKGWTQPRAAREIGVSAGHYRDLEAGRGMPRLVTAQRAAKVFGVRIEDIWP